MTDGNIGSDVTSENYNVDLYVTQGNYWKINPEDLREEFEYQGFLFVRSRNDPRTGAQHNFYGRGIAGIVYHPQTQSGSPVWLGPELALEIYSAKPRPESQDEAINDLLLQLPMFKPVEQKPKELQVFSK